MKNPIMKDLYNLIQIQNQNLHTIASKLENLDIKFNQHIIEFELFKSDMMSLPTIAKELQIK